jgi:hypothetical protein
MTLVAGCAAGHSSAASGSAPTAADGTPMALTDSAAATGEAGTGPPSAVDPTARAAAKIATPIAEAVAKLRADASTNVNGKPHGATLYSTPFVKVDGSGRIQVYLHLTALGDEERAELTQAGAQIDVAMERLKLVQAWLPYERVEAVAALPFVTRITPPSYATPR